MCAESVLVSRQRSFQAGAGRRYARSLLGNMTLAVSCLSECMHVMQCGDKCSGELLLSTMVFVCLFVCLTFNCFILLGTIENRKS